MDISSGRFCTIMKAGILITKVVMDEITRSKCMNPSVSLGDWDKGLTNLKA